MTYGFVSLSLSVHFSLTFLAWFIDGFVSLYKSDEVASQHLHLGGGEDVRLVDEHLIGARGGRHLESVALTLTCPQNKVHWTVRYEGPCLVGHSKSTKRFGESKLLKWYE